MTVSAGLHGSDFLRDLGRAGHLVQHGPDGAARALLARLRDGIDPGRGQAGLPDGVDGPDLQDGSDLQEDPALQEGADALPPMQGGADAPAGVSLVTCCMNRNHNLVRALGSWLAHPQISEIVIVDWNSTPGIAASLAEAGIDDARIRILRIEDEPRWVLSYAFNAGFRMARYDRVLKADADIVLAPDFFDRNPLEPGQFIAGNWRQASAGQEFVNGFFYTHRADLAAVNGFNEYITSYGWDDDDLYDRMVAAGSTRHDVAPDTVTHLDHDDDARMKGAAQNSATGWSDLQAQTMYAIRTNRFLARLLPQWDRTRRLMGYVRSIGDDSGDESRDSAGAETGPVALRLRRVDRSGHLVPDDMLRMAKTLAAYEMLSWRSTARAFALEARALDLLLTCRRLDQMTALHVELALAGADAGLLAAPRFLVADLPEAVSPARLAPLRDALLELASETGRRLVLGPLPDSLRGADLTPLTDPPGQRRLIVLAPECPLGPLRGLDLHDCRHEIDTPAVRLTIGPHTLAALLPTPADDLAAPGLVRPGEGRLFIDAQHGLGNRLRAIGSAGAIARATGRELVVIWEPDHHCEARLTDLFDYDGAVIEQGFADRAAARGATVMNYMEIEQGAAKGAPLELVTGRDAYLRSAYVIAHPASTWDSENAALRALRPAAPVRALMRGVADHRDIGLHVRMEGAPGTDTHSYDRRENWTADGHAAIHHWRGQSHYSRFMTRLDALLADQPEARVFLAADLPDTYRAFAETYGARVAWLERAVYDRSGVQLQYALADMLLLARCRQLLGSNWSSFSELALRLSDTITHHERSGIDF